MHNRIGRTGRVLKAMRGFVGQRPVGALTSINPLKKNGCRKRELAEGGLH